MNRDDELPADPQRETGPDAFPERLVEIERQLRKSRPALPRLDVAVIERLAREPSAPTDSWPAAEPHVVLRHRTGDDPRASRVRRYGIVASSWLCGAIVGAVAMYCYDGLAVPAVNPPPGTTIAGVAPQTATTRPPHETPVDSRKPPATVSPVANLPVAAHDTRSDALDLSWLASATSFDLYGRGDLRQGGEAVVWHAGMCLPGFALTPTPRVDARDGTGPATSPDPSVPDPCAPTGPEPDYEPLPEVTRDQLLRELLGDAAQPISLHVALNH